uniref:Uncharacterized protein n=1 Tax=Brassica campestris TaxID=3711 RepID=M4CS45_BRACM
MWVDMLLVDVNEGFRFRDQSELLGLANINTQLPDIIGEILGVKSTVTDPPEEKNRVMVTIKMDSDDTATLSLFDSQAVAFHKQLEAMRVDPKVIVATSINPKMVGGDHKEAKYLYGVLLMALGMIEKGKKILTKLTEDDGLDPVEMSWENVQESLSQLNVRMKDVDITDDGVDMGVSSSGTHNVLKFKPMNLVRVVTIYNIASVYYSSGDQTGIGSRLSRRAQMLIRSSKTTQSPSVDRVTNIVYKEIFKDVQTTQVHEDT